MKQAKKIMAAILALTMVSAVAPMSVFAGTVTEGDENPKTDGDFKVSYTYTPEPEFTVTIPAGVTLSDDEVTTADITAEGVENLDGKMINVELTSGTYTTEGSTFHAKNGDSVVTYTISKGNEMISVGDIVAEFESNGSQTLTFSKPDKSNATVAGEHTENLTFTVSVRSTASVDQDGQILDSWADIVAACNDGSYKTKYEIGNWKELDLGTEGIVKMKIVAMDADELADGSGNKAPITWISEQLLNTKHEMNPAYQSGTEGTGAIGGWEKSEMRSYLQNTILPLITSNESALSPASNGIKVVKKYTRIVNTSEEVENNKVTTDSVWIPSAWEMFGSGSGFETMGANYSEVFTDDASRVKKMSGGNAAWWWLRSALNNGNFYSVYTDGSSDYSFAAGTGGVALGFCT